MKRIVTMFDNRELIKRIRRLIDTSNYSYRKVLLLFIILGGAFMYFGPIIVQWLFKSSDETPQGKLTLVSSTECSYKCPIVYKISDFEDRCLNDLLSQFQPGSVEYNLNILHVPLKSNEHNYLPYIGNGVFGIPITSDSVIHVKQGRSLSLPVQFQPFVYHSMKENEFYGKEASVMDYTKGIVFNYQCIREGYYIESQYYASRVMENILVQEIQITNTLTVKQNVKLEKQEAQHWSNSRTEIIKIQVDGTTEEHNLISGYVPLNNINNKIVAVSIAYKLPQRTVQLKGRSTVKMRFLTGIDYSEPISMEEYSNYYEITKRNAIETLKRALSIPSQSLKDDHISLWQSYWYTGLTISDSKADGALNGHKINSTIYYVLSQVSKGVPNVEKNVAMNEGCYRGHHTLDAPRLWQDTSTITSVNSVVEAWLVTLEKQGCHRLTRGDPKSVQQAIVLSLGSFRFSNQHLEFNIDPHYLHRDYLFRRISYGNVTHLNISITVGEDNRAIMRVALDKSDSIYYGCDAGCLDNPVSLSQNYINIPVKLTKPLTAILYITSDHQHMQDLRNALHVHAIDDAPAHDHLVMALHKHGHQLGGLPTFFWVSICFLIIVFHLFLCKLVINEYHSHQDKQKVRYSKL